MGRYCERDPCHGHGYEHGMGPDGFESIVRIPERDHNRLSNRDEANQHPISAISGLQEVLDELKEEVRKLKENPEPVTPPEPEVEELYPTTIEPKVVLTVAMAEAYEVGTAVTPAYTAKLEPGSYTYGPETGIVAAAWEVTDSEGHTADTAAGSFADVIVTGDMRYTITAAATYGAGTIPETNIGNKYQAGQILPGKKTAKVEKTIAGYRRGFYGTTTDKGEITSDTIRNLAGKSAGAVEEGREFKVTVPEGAMRVIIAYPATLRNLKSVKDENCMNMQIVSAFTQKTIAVEGANGYEAVDYKVYVQEFAVANDTENTYAITI